MEHDTKSESIVMVTHLKPSGLCEFSPSLSDLHKNLDRADCNLHFFLVKESASLIALLIQK